MNNTILTVLMSVHNGSRYLKDAINSILNQTYRNFLFIIIDNASTDNSGDIIRKYNDSRIKLIKFTEKTNLATALNHGLALAKTKYVARIDADDISHPDRFSLQIEFLQKNPEIALLGSSCEYIDTNNEVIGKWIAYVDHTQIINAFSKHNPFAHSSVIFNKNVVLEFSGYSENLEYAQDLSLWVKISSKYKTANINELLTQIRIHDNQITNDPFLSKTRLKENIYNFATILSLPGVSIINKLHISINIIRSLIILCLKYYK